MKTNRHRINRFIILLFLMIAPCGMLFPQGLINYYSNDILTDTNRISFGFDKNNNIFNFKENAELFNNSLFGNLYFKNSYAGTAVGTNTNSFREEQISTLIYSYMLNNDISIKLNQNWLYNSDTKSIGINKLNRLNLMPSIKYNYLNNSFIELGFGREYNEQLNVSSWGNVLFLSNKLDNYKIEDMILSSNLAYAKIDLSDNRKNSDFSLDGNLQSIYSGDNTLQIKSEYRSNQRAFINSLAGTNSHYLIENRLDNKFISIFDINYNLTKNFIIGANIEYRNQKIERSYNTYNTIISNSLIFRNLNVTNYNFELKALHNTELLSHFINIRYESNEEKYDIKGKFDIEESELNKLRTLEQENNIVSSRIKLLYNANLCISEKDSLSFSYLSMLLKYDTPSKDNSDDHDEYTNIINLKYKHNFRKNLSLILNGEFQQFHLVYLFADKSNQNNWLRSISFSPQIKYFNSFLSINPKMEVLANYTVYDFEELLKNVSTYSFRQISFKDSSFIKFNERLGLLVTSLYRYNERGILYWKDFKESPQNANKEQLYRFMFKYNIFDENTFGIGVRIYDFQQKQLSANQSSNSYGNIHKSIGPEAQIGIVFSNYGKLTLSGWYEFQDINGTKREMPNLFLKTDVKF